MANERFDNDLPNIVLDKEDRDAFQRARAKEKSKTKEQEESHTGPAGGGSKTLTIFALLIALGGCGASYYLYKVTQEQQVLLTDAQTRVTDLERRLSVTGEEMDQSAGALRVKVSELSDKTEELWVQMDKLWASAWRKNQSEINALEGKVTNNAKDFKQKLALVEADSTALSTNLAIIQEQLSNQAESVAQSQTLLNNLQTNDNNNKRQIGDIQAKIIAIDQVNAAITRRVAELEKWRRTPQASSESVTSTVP